MDSIISTALPGGTLNVNGTLINTTVNRPDFGSLKIDLSNLTLTGLASFTEIEFPTPTSAHNITLAAILDTCPDAGSCENNAITDDEFQDRDKGITVAASNPPLNLSFHTVLNYVAPAMLELESHNPDVNDFETWIGFKNLDVLSNLTLLINRTRLEHIRLADISIANLVCI